jgi:hypothetical protein
LCLGVRNALDDAEQVKSASSPAQWGPRMDDLLWTKRAWSGFSAYAESKLCDVLLAFAVARRWEDVKSIALEPGWVPTKMGGPSATGDLHQGCVTQAWLATSEDELARSTGGYFYHQRPRAPNPVAGDDFFGVRSPPAGGWRSKPDSNPRSHLSDPSLLIEILSPIAGSTNVQYRRDHRKWPLRPRSCGPVRF